jgi:hypothetical protein
VTDSCMLFQESKELTSTMRWRFIYLLNMLCKKLHQKVS